MNAEEKQLGLTLPVFVTLFIVANKSRRLIAVLNLYSRLGDPRPSLFNNGFGISA
jgi:hypothetical protein